MRILVAGAQGQVARSLVERASARPDIELVAIGRPGLDLEQSGTAMRVVADLAPDVVINAAAFTAVDDAESEPERAFRINSDAAGELAAAAAQAGAAIIHLSTDYVFDGSTDHPYDEDAPTEPLNVYGRSKLAGEEQVRAANPRHIVVRTAWLYSPFGRNFVATMMSAAASRPSLSVVDDQRGSPTSALDLAEALLHVATCWLDDPARGLGRTYHLAGSTVMSWYDLAAKIMQQRGERGLSAPAVQPIKSADWPTKAARPGFSALDSTRFCSEFCYAMPPWEKSLAKVVSRLS